AAETIVFSVSSLEFSIAVESLAHYAETGEIRPDFADVAVFLNDDQLAGLRRALNARVDISPVVISQFLYSSQGEAVLGQIGELILTRKRQSGFYALRAALILAAADPETGLTPLNVLHQFPVDGIRINSTLVFDLVGEVGQAIEDTEAAIASIERQAEQQAIQAAAEFPLDLRQPGELTFARQTLLLNDRDRQRVFPADLYLPDRLPNSSANASADYPQGQDNRLPLVIISHGLGSDRQTFVYLAEHLASHGFAVAVPEHPGSNAAQIQALAAGRESDLTPPSELVDRPLDIQFLLDQLAEEYSDRLNTQRVGVVGQSFGGYTALALAGAQLNVPALADTCPEALLALNWSLVLQCSALRLAEPLPRLQDERVAAVIAINPLTSQIFDTEQLGAIALPMVWVAGGADTVTPALPEQLQPFTRFSTPNKYLALLSKGTHFSALAATEGDIALPEAVLGPDPQITHAYLRALSLGFFGTAIGDRPDLRPYLSPSYGGQISDARNPLSLLAAPVTRLEEEEF
ncbi:MAG: alpha/beta hydrolase, partial [Spirulinaceae cyanobacterium]